MNSLSPVAKGLIVGAIHVLLVASLGAKLLYDRHTHPRVWVQTQAFDPDLPIRGRYLSESLIVPGEGPFRELAVLSNRARLEVRSGQLVAVPADGLRGEWVTLRKNSDGTVEATLQEPVLFFIPDTAKVPTLKPGQRVWVEVTVPAQGPPRPIRIGIKENGIITPLNLN